ncbi:MAG: hypothetical protein ACO3B9_01475, partial [Burkholderiaceae bacterium]
MNKRSALSDQSLVRRFGSMVFAGGLTALVAVTLALGSALTPVTATAQSAANRGLPDFTGLIDKAGPAVVNIRTLSR